MAWLAAGECSEWPTAFRYLNDKTKKAGMKTGSGGGCSCRPIGTYGALFLANKSHVVIISFS